MVQILNITESWFLSLVYFRYVWKLLYAYMLGYDIDFGHFQVRPRTAVQRCVARVRRGTTSRPWSSAPHRNSVRRLPGTALSCQLNSAELRETSMLEDFRRFRRSFPAFWMPTFSSIRQQFTTFGAR
jgi:hypothetical protein